MTFFALLPAKLGAGLPLQPLFPEDIASCACVFLGFISGEEGDIPERPRGVRGEVFTPKLQPAGPRGCQDGLGSPRGRGQAPRADPRAFRIYLGY